MSLKQHVVSEFEIRVFEENYTRLYKCLEMLKEEHIWKSPSNQIPSVGCLILHLCGNARQWMLSGLSGLPDNRERDEEFLPHENIRKSDFIFLLENLKIQLKECLHEVPERELKSVHSIQGFHVTGFSAVMHVLEHFSYHTGQITTLTKLHTGKETQYYDHLDLNKHNKFNN